MSENFRDNLIEVIPENCQECRRAVLAAAIIALKATEAGVGFEVASDRFNSLLDTDCTGPEPATCSTIGCQHKAGDRYLSDAVHELSFEQVIFTAD